MTKRLVIAEKPSVGMSIAAVLGAKDRKDGYIEGRDYIVSWGFGHLAELANADTYDEKYAKWRYDDLPIIPANWKYKIPRDKYSQFETLKKLMNRADVSDVINACDAGREGELIFRNIYKMTGCKKPIYRLWISSMEDTAIREGFANLKPGTEYDALYEAALCRERADWIVGINATRLFSCLYGVTLNVGRVMTPTLGMVVLREAAISAFMPEPFYTVQITVNDFAVSSDRFKGKTDAESCRKACLEAGMATVRKVERREKSEKPPALYDLTTLQREANRLFGFTAQQTLDYTQSLYEKKLVTYPRTDSRYLTEDMAASLPGLAENSALAFGVQSSAVVHASAVINGKKVTDHHALLPTASMAKADLAALPAGEQSVLRMIVARLLAAVSEPHRYAETAVELSCAGTVFSAKGKEILDDGWKAMERQLLPKEEKAAKMLPPLVEGETLPIEKTEIKEGKTSPPKHFTEDLLLQAMEAASADDFPEDAERKGIGTPATRAAIIEKLVLKGFLERKGSGKVKTLIPTEKGKALITVTPEQLQSPAMTADWEEKLSEVEHGEYVPETFMDEISGMIMELVNNYEIVKGAKVLMPGTTVIGTCPHCGAEVIERQKGWFCSNRECRFILWKDNAYFKKIGKRLTAQMAERLVRDGRIRVKDCKSQKTGKTYNASVLLTTEADGRPKFQLEFESGGGGK